MTHRFFTLAKHSYTTCIHTHKQTCQRHMHARTCTHTGWRHMHAHTCTHTHMHAHTKAGDTYYIPGLEAAMGCCSSWEEEGEGVEEEEEEAAMRILDRELDGEFSTDADVE